MFDPKICATLGTLEELHISCDGQYPHTTLVCFTDHDPSSPSYGASFNVDFSSEMARAIRAALLRKRAQFAAAEQV